jgi:tetratricopeptide (TPR) repeat protein
VVEQVRGNLGWSYYSLGDFDRALALLSSSEALAGEIGRENDRQLWLGDIGNIYLPRRDFDRAISYYQKAKQMAVQTGNRLSVVIWLDNCAWASLGKLDLSAAESFSREELRAEQGLPDRSAELNTKLNLATVANKLGRFDLAEAGYRDLIAHSAEQPGIAWEAWGGLAQMYHTQGKLEEAEKAYQNAIAISDREWAALARDQSKITYLEQVTDLYQDYVAFLTERGQAERSLEAADTSRARLLAQKVENVSAAPPRFRPKQPCVSPPTHARSCFRTGWLRNAPTSGSSRLRDWRSFRCPPSLKSRPWSISTTGRSSTSRIPSRARVTARDSCSMR